MHSDFVITLRKVPWESSKFPNVNDVLSKQYDAILALLKKKALSQPKMLKQFALNTHDEMIIEEQRVKEKADLVRKEIGIRLARKGDQNRLNPKDFGELQHWESELGYFNEILTSIDDAKGALLEYLVAYFPEEVATNDSLIKSVRILLPPYTLYRKKIEAYLSAENLRLSKESQAKLTSQADQAVEIIGNLNFEKACQIICTELGRRMPGIATRALKLRDLKEGDKKGFQTYEGLSQTEIENELRHQIITKRDSVINSYHSVLGKIESKSVDPEFTKEQAKKSAYSGIINNKEHLIVLRQYPSDWNNTELFGSLWGYASLIFEWRNHKIIKKNKAELAVTLPELFHDSRLVGKCVSVLKEVEPPLIGEMNNYIGKSKGAFCVWIDVLKKLNLIKSVTDRKVYAAALNNYFKNFSVDESMFGKTQKRAETQYKASFNQLLSNLKSSQSSHL